MIRNSVSRPSAYFKSSRLDANKRYGVTIIPYPCSVPDPPISSFNDISIVRCRQCQSILNKFGRFLDGNYVCPFCDMQNYHTLSIGSNEAAFKSDVYDFYTMKEGHRRPNFKITDVFCFSLSVLKRFPDLLCDVLHSISSSYPTRLFSIVLIHGSVSVFKFTPKLQVLTYADIYPMIMTHKLFTGVNSILDILPQVSSFVEQAEDSEKHWNLFTGKFLMDLACQHGSSLHLFLSESHQKLISPSFSRQSDLYTMSRRGVGLSAHIFAESPDPEISLSVPIYILGGNLIVHPSYVEKDSVSVSAVNCIRHSLHHDVSITVSPISAVKILNFVGPGCLESNTLTASKIRQGFPFHFEIQIGKNAPLLIQFAVSSISPSGLSKIRVITLDLGSSSCPDTPYLVSLHSAMVAKAIIFGEEKQISKSLQNASRDLGSAASDIVSLRSLTGVRSKMMILDISRNTAEGEPKTEEKC